MSREHTPRPGVTWEQQLKQIERQLGTPVTNDDYRRIQPPSEVLDIQEPWGWITNTLAGRHLESPGAFTSEGPTEAEVIALYEQSTADTRMPDGNLPLPPRPNRADRRAAAREARRSGRQPGDTPCRRYDGQPHAQHAWRGFADGPAAWCPGIPERR